MEVLNCLMKMAMMSGPGSNKDGKREEYTVKKLIGLHLGFISVFGGMAMETIRDYEAMVYFQNHGI